MRNCGPWNVMHTKAALEMQRPQTHGMLWVGRNTQRSWSCTGPAPRITSYAWEKCPNIHWTLAAFVLWPLPFPPQRTEPRFGFFTCLISTVTFTKKTEFMNNLMAFSVKMDAFGHMGRAMHVIYLNFSSSHCPPKQSPIQVCTLHWMHRQLHGLKTGARHHWNKFSVGSLCGWCLQHSPCEDRLRFLGLFSWKSWVWRKDHLWECFKKHWAKPFTALWRDEEQQA